MSDKPFIILCDQDSAIGDLLFCTLQKLAGRISRLRGRSSLLAAELLERRADLLIVNGTAKVGELLHIMRCCKAKYPDQKQIFITAVFEGYEEELKATQLDGLIFKPFKINQLNDMVAGLLPSLNRANQQVSVDVISRIEQLSKIKIAVVMQYLKSWLTTLQTVWHNFSLRELENERLITLKTVYRFCLSKFSSYRFALKLWHYLEFLERHYLLIKGGADVEREALKFHYTMLKSKLERGMQGKFISMGEGDGFGPKLDLVQFGQFYERLRRQEVSFGCFRLAAQARLVRWACDRPPMNELKYWAQGRRCLERHRHLSYKASVAEAEAELKFLAAASEPGLQEVFSQVWG
ncbi:MAG: hypothetical protein ACI38Q_03290 [Candidatus Bruticola sp.]